MRRLLKTTFLFLLMSFWLSGLSLVLAQDGGIDIALAVNGSGSISDDDFTLQKSGIKAALQNPLVFPRDGSVAVTLIQYADGTTQVHIPYTVINNSGDINSLVAQVDGIVQIQGSTNPGDGINAVMNVLNASGNPDNTQSICLSTDGLPNSGASVQSALNAAQASPIGLDKFSVLAIEDPPGVLEEDFDAFYGTLVFDSGGSGTVTVVENSTAYANILGATCLAPETELIGLEVTQAIQDWKNSVPLVEGKTTYVRAFIQSKDSAPAPATARLRAYQNGSELPESPLTAINNSSFTASAQTSSDQDVIDLRDDLDGSLNFRLPPDWLSGTVELRIEGSGSLDCQEVADTPNDCSVEVSFEPVAQPEIKFVQVKWTSSGGQIYEPSSRAIDTLAGRLNAIYPTAGIGYTTGQMKWTRSAPPNLDSLNMRLESRRFWDFCWSTFGCDRLYYGVLRGPDQGGKANGIPGEVASGTMPSDPWVYGRNRHAHEFGHDLGERHVNYCMSPRFQDPRSPNFPYAASIGGKTVATLGPLSMEDAEVWGFDTYAKKVVDPRQNFELMSYCGTWRWISDFTYKRILAALDDTFDGILNNRLLASKESEIHNINDIYAQTGLENYLVVRGTVNVNDNEAGFLPFGSVSSSVSPPVPPSGDYILQLLDGEGEIILERSFQPNDYHVDAPAEDSGFGTFIIPTLKDPAIEEAKLLYNGAVVASRSASLNSPTVEVTFPNGGEGLSGDQTTLEWDAEDADGDSLTYVVQYSRDGGSTWKTLAVDWPDQSYDIDLDFLGETSNGLIRVQASDGFNTSTDPSDGFFSTPNNAPNASILSPESDAQFIGVEPIFFEGRVIDREDGEVSGTSLQWASDLDGDLGTGQFNLDASELSEGEHTITLTATDSNGATDAASVNITVSRVALPPPLIDDTPPVCGPIDLEKNASGKLLALSTSASDAESGITSVKFTRLENLEGFLNGTGNYRQGDVETFDASNTTSVDIRGERIDMDAGGAIITTVTNGVDLTAQCDPVVETIAAEVPESFKLMGNYPNPFSQQTTIEFAVAEPVSVRLEVYDVLGRKVATLADEEMAPGTYKLTWDGRSESGQPLASGVYIYRIDAGSFSATRKLTLVR